MKFLCHITILTCVASVNAWSDFLILQQPQLCKCWCIVEDKKGICEVGLGYTRLGDCETSCGIYAERNKVKAAVCQKAADSESCKWGISCPNVPC